MLKNVWFTIVLVLIALVLSTNPKTSIAGTEQTQGNNFLRIVTWLLIATFYTTTLLLSYYG